MVWVGSGSGLGRVWSEKKVGEEMGIRSGPRSGSIRVREQEHHTTWTGALENQSCRFGGTQLGTEHLLSVSALPVWVRCVRDAGLQV